MFTSFLVVVSWLVCHWVGFRALRSLGLDGVLDWCVVACLEVLNLLFVFSGLLIWVLLLSAFVWLPRLCGCLRAWVVLFWWLLCGNGVVVLLVSCWLLGVVGWFGFIVVVGFVMLLC